jgi:hypothetical protein
MKVRLWPLLAATLLVCASPALAKPPGPSTFCAKYPTAPTCVGAQPACIYCHTAPPTLNEYGTAISAKLAPAAPRPLSDGDYTTGLPAALTAVESIDSDADGVTNLVEIQKGTFPGDKKSFPNDVPCAGGANPSYSVCKYDYAYVFRKVVLDFCGASPTYEQLQSFRAMDAAGKTNTLDATLDFCLGTEFWRGKNGQVWQLGHRKIRPVGSLHRSGMSPAEEEGLAPLVDYYDDYALYAYSQLDDHDAREVLTANFFVSRTPPGTVPTVYTKVNNLALQGVDTVHRAGNLTSAWTLAYNIMFTALPRNAAAQAYRGYLGLDIAKQEGLYAIPNEPKDYDGKGVTQSLCTQCHATLDPLSYPFRNYNGLTGPGIVQYVPMRIETHFAGEAPNIGQIPEKGFIFGQPVNNVVEWAQVAANSDAFLVATTNDYWKLLLGRPPLPEENAEFVNLWKRLKAPNNYSVKKMLHELIRTEAYGAP